MTFLLDAGCSDNVRCGSKAARPGGEYLLERFRLLYLLAAGRHPSFGILHGNCRRKPPEDLAGTFRVFSRY